MTRAWEYAAIGIILFVAVYLLFIPPIIGFADRGDYIRIGANAGLGTPPDTPYYANTSVGSSRAETRRR